MRGYYGGVEKNLAQINGRATLPDDDVNLAIRMSNAPNVETVRLYLSLETSLGAAPAPSDFTQDYFFYEWRKNDIATAIQGTNTDPVASLQAANARLLEIAQINAYFNPTGNAPNPTRINVPIGPGSASSPLAIGNNQWITLRCKIRDLIRIGTDPSKTLANVLGAEVLVNVLNAPVTVSVDTLWISGGYQPNADRATSPYTWAYRYRSSITGAKSNPSPTLRALIRPQRQPVQITGVQSPDPQTDLVDWFRFGGSIAGSLPMYAGTTRNVNPPVFTDVYSDAEITAGGELLDYDRYQPWLTIGDDAEGTVNISGTAVSWVSGDLFNVKWIPGTIIFLNGQPYTLYAQPRSTTFLEVVENVGALFATSFKLQSPRILGANQPTWWGQYYRW